jgi:hypothetical protein
MTDEVVRAALFRRLTKIGWISNTWAKDIAPNQVQYKLQYTKLGLIRMRELYKLLEELGFTHGNSFRKWAYTNAAALSILPL